MWKYKKKLQVYHLFHGNKLNILPAYFFLAFSVNVLTVVLKISYTLIIKKNKKGDNKVHFKAQ